MRAYVKPELFYERYELSQHIADCQWEINNLDKNSCVATGDVDDGMSGMGTLFTSTAGCTLPDTDYQDYCYTTGADGVNIKVWKS